MTALVERGGYSELELYDTLLSGEFEAIDPTKIEKLKAERSDAVLHYAALEIWELEYAEYVDEFQNEICLALRRGELCARGTELDRQQGLQSPLGTDLTDRGFSKIPKARWLSSDIDWEASAIDGRTGSFVWVHLKVEDMLRLFPPAESVKDKIFSVGTTFAMASAVPPAAATQRSLRGRPPLPWHEFHVEIARMFRDGEMPQKKEAAIAALQNWFQIAHGKSASRAAIGERLKPYFDQLIRNDKKSTG
jgi:hypothetical protein